MSTEDWTEDPAAREWAKEVYKDLSAKIGNSALTMQIVPDDGVGDVKLWLELGASIMMGKPIIAVVVGDREIPPRLAEVADEVVQLESFDSGPDHKKLIDAIDRILPDGPAPGDN